MGWRENHATVATVILQESLPSAPRGIPLNPLNGLSHMAHQGGKARAPRASGKGLVSPGGAPCNQDRTRGLPSYSPSNEVVAAGDYPNGLLSSRLPHPAASAMATNLS